MKMKKRMKKHSLKFVAAFLSLFLWIYVLNSEKIKFEKTVLLEYILPEDMVFAQKPPHEVTFLIEGPRAFVRTVTEREEKLIIDLNRTNSKRLLNFQVDINPTQLSLPLGMAVERVLPRKLTINLEKKVSKIVPIKLQFMGQLPEKVELKNIQISPPEVEVNGPRSVIMGLKEILSRPVDLELMLGHNSIALDIQLPDERLILTSSKDFRVHYELKAIDANYTLQDLPIKFLTDAKKFTPEGRSASVRLLLPKGLTKNRLNISSSVQIFADIPKNAKGRVEVPLRVSVPAHIHVLEVTPKTIIVNVR